MNYYNKMYMNAGLTVLGIMSGFAYYSAVVSQENKEKTSKACVSEKFEKELCLKSNGPLARCDDAVFALKVCLEKEKSA